MTEANACEGGGCGCEGGVDRRTVLAAAGAMASLAGLPHGAIAGPFAGAEGPDHFVPEDKKLAPEWVAALFARGEPEWFSGRELQTIGMPVGGLCAGQIYLSGDGRLVGWDVFNENGNTGYGVVNYQAGRDVTITVRGQKLTPWPELAHGFAVKVADGERTVTRSLDRRGFPAARFRGEHPIGLVEYPADDELPLRVRLEAWSPFVPLDAERSAHPATVLDYTLHHDGEAPIEVTIAGWLENVVAQRGSQDRFGPVVRRRNDVVRGDRFAAVRASAALHREVAQPRPPVRFADFEGDDYGDWQVAGEALGKGPAHGTLPDQQRVSGFDGKGLVDTFLGGDGPKGTLTSPEFTIERPWIGFLIGGGDQPEATCLRLRVGDEIVRVATGRNRERLEPSSWDVRDLVGKRARLEIVDAASGGWGHVNVDRIEFRDEPMAIDPEAFAAAPDAGTMALAVLAAGDAKAGAFVQPKVAAGGDPFSAIDAAPQDGTKVGDGDVAVVGRTVRLAPGESVRVTFVVAWCFANLVYDDKPVGNRYAERFGDAVDVVRSIAGDHDALRATTRLWRETWYDSTLPYWLLDRLHAPVSTLASTTCQWWRDGRFWAWEGGGCCHGTCGHVWNYAHAVARLFPELERSVREQQDFKLGVGFHEDGHIGFRGEGWDLWAGDSQPGYVLKAYREHLCSADDAFLWRVWPAVKQALEFLFVQDGDGDGLIEGRQHQTYDENYFGANTFVGALYLAALRAGEEMAKRLGDDGFAARCRTTFERGSQRGVARLFDEERGYFVQDVDLQQHPDWQYGDGCLADQLFGQSWAHQVGLGYVYPKDVVRTALASVYRYDWAPDVGPQNEHHAPERWFARPGEAGLLTCTWPHDPHMGKRSTRYRNEVWTGIEYQVASHLAWEGMVQEALAICRGVHERYRPGRHNPYNEIECGDHYARALASWGVLVGLSGFEYDGPAGRLGFAPRLTPERFRSAFTAAEGWGALDQQRVARTQAAKVEVKWGKVRLRTVALVVPEGAVVDGDGVQVMVGAKGVDARVRQEGQRVVVELGEEVVVGAGDVLAVTMSWA